VDIDRLDFARVLIATSSLEVVKRVERLMVDDNVVDVQVIEEWGYDMGDDACLLVDDRAVETSLCDQEEDQCDPETSHHVDKLVEDFADGLANVAGSALQQAGDNKHVSKSFDKPLLEERPDCPDPVLKPGKAIAGVSMGSCGVSVDWVAETAAPSHESVGHVHEGLDATRHTRTTKGSGCQRTRSCPPRVRRPAFSGPWSLEWLQDHAHEEAGVIFSSKKRAQKPERPGVGRQRVKHKGAKKRKGGGPLCHALFSLKRIARLPRSDRQQVLHILHKNARREKDRGSDRSSREETSRASDAVDSSSGSATNDWKHWVALQGDDRKAATDVAEVGRSLGVLVNADQVNKFSVLSKAGKGKQSSPVYLMEGEV
jgi:hypothetical protein